MECNDERARRLLPSFDGVLDAGDQDYLERHLAVCADCSRRREKFRQLDRLFQKFLLDTSQEHLETPEIDRYLINPGSLSKGDVDRIELHLQICKDCAAAKELLAQCNAEISEGSWDTPSSLSSNEMRSLQRENRENQKRLRALLVSESGQLNKRHLNNFRSWSRTLIGRKGLAWISVVLVVCASITIYFLNTTADKHTRSAETEIRLVSPENSKELTKPYLFRWEPADNVIEYEMDIKDIESLDKPVLHITNLLHPSYELTEADVAKLEAGKLYQWEVLGVTESRRTVHSPIRVFKTPAR